MPQNPIGDRSTLIQVMGIRLSGNKPLPEPMLTQMDVINMVSLGNHNVVSPKLAKIINNPT